MQLFVSLCQGDLVCVTYEECLFLSFSDTPVTCCTLTLSYYVLSCPKDPEEVRIKTAHFILFEKGCVFGCVSSAGRAALSHRNVVSLTVSPSSPLWACFTQHLPVNQTARLWSLTLADSEEVTRVQPHTECIDHKAEMSFRLAEWDSEDISGSRMKRGKNGRFLIVIITDSQ